MTSVQLGAAVSGEIERFLPALIDLGVERVRFPVSWRRLQPEGDGELEVGEVRRLLDELGRAGIEPNVVLYREGLPDALARAGGWAVRSTAEAFGEFARAMARALDDVALWTTLDAPWASAFLGPGAHTAPGGALAAAHHLALAHGLATTAIREERGRDTQVSIALDLHVTRSGDDLDLPQLEAATAIDLVAHHLFLGPLFDGSYPPELLARTRHLTDWSFVRAGDLLVARQRLDELQLTYRGALHVQSGDTVGADPVAFVRATAAAPVPEPAGLTDVVRSVAAVFPGVPLAVAVPIRGTQAVTDLAEQLSLVEEAVADGIAVRAILPLLDDSSTATVAAWYTEVIARHREARTRVEVPAGRPGVLQRLLRKRR